MNKPAGKKITSVNPLIGALGLFQAESERLLGKPWDLQQKTDVIGGITVDTSFPSDTKVWETGIKRESIEKKWVIVSQYESEEEAKEGHKQWVEYMKEEPEGELKDIDNWNLGLNEEES